MSVNTKLIAVSAISGAHKVVAQAKDYLARAYAAKGADAAVGFPDTNYALPVIYSMLGEKVSKLSDLQGVIDECDRLLPAVPSRKSGSPTWATRLTQEWRRCLPSRLSKPASI